MLAESNVQEGVQKLGLADSEATYATKANDIKKNIMTFYSLKFVLEVIVTRLNPSTPRGEIIYHTNEEIDSLISAYGVSHDPIDFENSLTRVYLQHLPLIIDKFLTVNDGFMYPKQGIAEEVLLYKDESLEGEDLSENQQAIENDIQLVMNFLILLNSIKVNKFYDHSQDKDGKREQHPYHYNYNPANKSNFVNRPVTFVTDKVAGDSIAELDEFWLKNNYSNIAQYLAYLYSDLLQVGRLSFNGHNVTSEDLYTNPGYPYTLKALNLAAISRYQARAVNLAEREELLNSGFKETALVRSLSAGREQESSQEQVARPQNKVRVFSGFELEIGIEDDGNIAIDRLDLFQELKKAVQKALLNKATKDERIPISEDDRDEILSGLAKLSRSEYVLLHLILCDEVGANVAFMEIPRANMAAKIIEHLRSGQLKQSITDVIYAYEVNIDQPCRLHDTVETAQRLEDRLYQYYVPNFAIKIAQAPSFQLNISVSVADQQGRWINTSCPAVNYQTFPGGMKKIQSIQYTVFYTELLAEVNRELTKLITDEITGIFRCSKLVSHIDWKVYPIEERMDSILASDASSYYARHRHDTGKSASIRVVPGDEGAARFEIRLFGPNVHMEAQMPNRETFNEGIFRQADLLAIVAEKVLNAVDIVNKRSVYNPMDLATECNGLIKPFERSRGLSGEGSVRSGYSGVSDVSWLNRLAEEREENASVVTGKEGVSSICITS